MRELSVKQLADWLQEDRLAPVIVDVREHWEWELCRIEGSLHMPMGTVPARSTELNHEADIVCVCHHGVRSAQVAFFLERNGFDRVYNLVGGIHAWAEEADPSMAKY